MAKKVKEVEVVEEVVGKGATKKDVIELAVGIAKGMKNTDEAVKSATALEAKKWMKIFEEVYKNLVEEGKPCNVMGICNFDLVERAERIVRNPSAEGAPVIGTTPAHESPKFKPVSWVKKYYKVEVIPVQEEE